jgi:hypothetical protein
MHSKCTLAALLSALTLVGGASAAQTTTFAATGSRAAATLLHVWYAGKGQWKICNAPDCGKWNRDWGADALTNALYLRWTATHDRAIATALKELTPTSPNYGAPCTSTPCGWSDVPAWDAIASLREYDVTRDPLALAKAKTAFSYVEDSKVYAVGACPRISYQQPNGEANHLKTLETDANMLKAALLLYRATKTPAYLDSAVRRYAAARAYFLDPALPLYSVYVFDDGKACTQVPHRFFASVNGDMIWNGFELSRAAHDARYLAEATATARAVDRYLSDPAGVFADLQAENDIVEPLVEGMYVLARNGHAAFARQWILKNAAAALAARGVDGSFGRFFDGPPPAAATSSQWQTNGGLALEIAAAALKPNGRVSTTKRWRAARYVGEPVTALPATVTMTGSAVAFVGTLGEHCCESGHARVFIDGVETFDGTGIWQNKASGGRSTPGTVLFAWRWPRAGTHTFRFEPGTPNGKEGDAFLHLLGYYVLG